MRKQRCHAPSRSKSANVFFRANKRSSRLEACYFKSIRSTDAALLETRITSLIQILGPDMADIQLSIRSINRSCCATAVSCNVHRELDCQFDFWSQPNHRHGINHIAFHRVYSIKLVLNQVGINL